MAPTPSSKRSKPTCVPVVSKLFQPFKAVGNVSKDLPFEIQTLGQSSFLTSCIGRTFLVFDMDKLNVVMVGKQCDGPISALTVRRENTFVAVGNKIIKYRRTHPTMTMESNHAGDIKHLEIFGMHLMSLSDDNVFQLWDFKTGEMYTEIEFPTESFRVSCVVHPDTYLNKVIFGSSQGTMQLWNLKTRKLIYTYKSVGSPITSLVQSPVVDVVAIGLLDGRIILYDVKKDKKLFSFKQNSKVSSITFRTDEHHHMATAGMDGDVAIWDLDTRKLFHVIKAAHRNMIPKVQYLNNQPLLVSSGADNSIKQWLFDTHDGLPRLLKGRSGHYAPPTKLHYYFGGQIISSGQDSTLRSFSAFKDSRSAELSQGKLEARAKQIGVDMDSLRLPPITDFAIHNAKQKRWDNILTVHLGMSEVRTWSLIRMALGEYVLTPPNSETAKVVAISQCGNFGLIGTAQGAVHQFNLQSGLLRLSTPDTERHSSAVTAVLTDQSNRQFVTTSLDGTIKVWDFQTFKTKFTVNIDSAVAMAAIHPDNGLVALACGDLVVRIVDPETQKVVRKLGGHTHRITGLTFSPDGRWIISSSLDGAVRTFDIPTGQLVDIFLVPSIVSSLSFSSFGDFLVTSHVDEVGLFLWSNKSLYSDVALKSLPINQAPSLAIMPGVTAETENEEDDASETEQAETEDVTEDLDYKSPTQLTSDMVTLSNAPWSKWQKLLNLETIKLRNKPIAPPKQPELAPFFLTATQGVNPQFVAPAKEGEDQANKERVINELGALESELIQLCQIALDTSNPDNLLNVMENLAPPQIDLEINLLSPTKQFKQHLTLLDALLLILQSKKGYELVQAYLNVYLNCHAEIISENKDIFETRLQDLASVNEEVWKDLDGLFRMTTMLTTFVRARN